MQLRKMSLMLTALSAVAVMLTGCPEPTNSLTCSADTDCLESELCHPDAKVCVQKCTSSAECPDTAKTCDVLSTTNSQKICKCSTTALCNTGRETADLACSTTYSVCVPTCTTDTDCAAGQTCDTTTNQCKSTTTTPPTGQTCSGEGQTTCNYGQFCSSTTCTAVPAPTCPNFEGKPAKNFDPATGTGNIIYNVEKLIFGGSSGCADAASQTVKARVRFYTKSGTLPTTKEGLNGFFYVRTTGGEQNAVPLSNEYQRSTDGKNASISVNLCTDATFDQIVLGFYFTGGNGYCATLTK
jgi:Cys-rich repeat protein